MISFDTFDEGFGLEPLETQGIIHLYQFFSWK